MLCGSTALARSDKATSKVEVDGKTYRVTRQGDAVVVARKSLIVAFDVAERDRQRAAVRKATGCSVVDELPSQDARLRGKLDCSEVRTAKP